VTVLALSTGFDVPDVDCIIWCRPTQSPVLYVQGMGRGTRIADGKTDCLVLDFTDTVARMGTVDTVTGRTKRITSNQEAPFCICPDCGERNVASALTCTACGATIREEQVKVLDASLSYAELLSNAKHSLVWHDITKVEYHTHRKEGKPDSLRVDYYSGILKTASEWVCFDHTGYAGQKAVSWWIARAGGVCLIYPTSVADAIDMLRYPPKIIKEPKRIATRQNGKYTEVRDYEFS
jgi:DNA repair protein RadD